MEEGQIQGKHLFPSSLYIHKKESLHVLRYSLPFCFVLYLQEEGKNFKRHLAKAKQHKRRLCDLWRCRLCCLRLRSGAHLLPGSTCQGRFLHCCLSVHGNLTGFNSTCLCCDQGRTECSQGGWKIGLYPLPPQEGDRSS